MYMLDTNILVYAIRHPKHEINQILKEHIAKDVCISAITYGELVYGVCKSLYPERNQAALQQFLSGIPIIDFNWYAAEHFGDIIANLDSKGLRIGERDMLIAAHARSQNDILVTNNTREFDRVENLRIEDWIHR